MFSFSSGERILTACFLAKLASEDIMSTYVSRWLPSNGGQSMTRESREQGANRNSDRLLIIDHFPSKPSSQFSNEENEP